MPNSTVQLVHSLAKTCYRLLLGLLGYWGKSNLGNDFELQGVYFRKLSLRFWAAKDIEMENLFHLC